MTDLDRAIASAREALANEGHRSADALRDLLAALDALAVTNLRAMSDWLESGTFNVSFDGDTTHPLLIGAATYAPGKPPRVTFECETQHPAALVVPDAWAEPGAMTDHELLTDFVRMCRESKPVGQWPGERVCAAIERSMAREAPFQFISKADRSLERNPSHKDSDRQFSGYSKTAAVPEGYALVPVEPTREMRRAAIGEYEDAMDARLPDGDGYDEEVVTRLYRAMLAATPAQQPAEPCKRAPLGQGDDMSTKHTPGPWTPFILDKPLSEIPTYVEKCIAAGAGEEFFFVAAEMPDGAVDVCHVGNGPRREANARLIAAAPELLDACKAARALTPDGTHTASVLDAAIAKAVGHD